jgi:putative transposase
MAGAVKISVSDRQRIILDRWCRKKADTPHRLIERCRIILMSVDGVSNVEQARRLGVDRQRVRRWRKRWDDRYLRLVKAEEEGANDADLTRLLMQLLQDAPRSGTPPTFTAEQLTRIFAIACEVPEDCGRPVTHWTPREIVDEAILRGVVDTISPRHVDRLLKGGFSDRIDPNTGSHPRISSKTLSSTKPR